MYLLTSENNNIIYSIDKIRLKTYISYSTFTEIEFRFQTVWKEYVKYKYTTGRYNEFFYNYNIEIAEDKSFWFGFLHNTEKREEDSSYLYNLTIEFNPNKLKDNPIVLYILSLSGQWYLKRIDMACDLKVNILDIIGYERGHKREVKVFSQGYDNRTIYIGKSNNRVKIYNKKIESNLNMLGDLTRIEISTDFDNFNIRDVKMLYYPDVFPSLYLNNYLYSIKDYEDKTLFCVLFSIQNGLTLDMLSRTYRAKVKKLLEGGQKIRFDVKTATEVLRKVIFHYFIKNKLVVFR